MVADRHDILISFDIIRDAGTLHSAEGLQCMHCSGFRHIKRKTRGITRPGEEKRACEEEEMRNHTPRGREEGV